MCEATDAAHELHDIAARFGDILSLMLTTKRRNDVRRNKSGDPTWTQHLILKSLLDGPIPGTGLADLHLLSRPALSIIVDRMERKDLVRRMYGALDRRTVLIEITTLGREACEHADSQIRCDVAAVLSDLTVEQRASLARVVPVLERLVGYSGRHG